MDRKNKLSIIAVMTTNSSRLLIPVLFFSVFFLDRKNFVSRKRARMIKPPIRNRTKKNSP